MSDVTVTARACTIPVMYRGVLRRGLLSITWLILAASCTDPGRVSGGSCVTNQNCPTGEQCVGGRCVTKGSNGCTTDDTCAIGEYCDPVSRTCETMVVTGCTNDEACPAHQRCNSLTGVCIDGNRSCTGDAQCTSIGKHCDTSIQQCVDCLLNTDCTSPTICLDGSCVDPSATMCATDSACAAPNTVCESGQCVPGCHRVGSPVLCGLGEFCDSNSGRCAPGQVTCMNDQACTPPATICESSQCIPGCAQVGGLQCTGGNVCSASTGRCQPPSGCSSDTQCGAPASVCELGQCVPGCGQPGGLQCGTGTVCDSTNGRCVTVQGPCQSDNQCGPPTGVCELGQCVPGCTQIGGIQCSGNTVCNAGSGRCDPGGAVCTTDAACNPPGTICDLGSGACVPGCGTTGCTPPQTCTVATGHCNNPGNPVGNLALNASCTTNADCASGVCFDFAGGIGARCVQSCGSSQDCPASFTCYDFNGGKMCISGQLFSGAPSLSTPNGGFCTFGDECHSNFCPDGSCVDSCSESSDCAGGQCMWQEFSTDLYFAACNGPLGSGTNGSSCGADSDCRGGVCYGSGTCGDLCGTTSDCPSGSVCGLVNYSICVFEFIGCLGWQPNFVKACVESTHGNGGVGTSCADATPCRSGLCFTTTGECTDTCSRNADCPSTHVCGVEQYGALPVSGGDDVEVFINVCKPRGS